MLFDDVYLVTPNRNAATQEQVTQAEQVLGTRFPSGYADFVTWFGEGSYCGFVRVCLPGRIVADYRAEFQQRWGEYFFWDAGRDVMPRDHVLESVIVADTWDGDELIFHPGDPDRLVVLPRHDDRIFEAGDGLEAALRWLCDSGELTAPIGSKWFESFTNRRRLWFRGPGDFDAVREALLGLGVHHHAEHVTDGDGAFFRMFVPGMQGTVEVSAREEVEAFVCHDANTAPASWCRISDQLEVLGLTKRSISGSTP
jgi:hypothetical protein